MNPLPKLDKVHGVFVKWCVSVCVYFFVYCCWFCEQFMFWIYPAAMMPCCQMKCDGTFSCWCVFRLHRIRNNKMRSIKPCVISARISTGAAAAYRWAVRCLRVSLRLRTSKRSLPLSLSFLPSWYLIPQCCWRIDGYNIIPHTWAASIVRDFHLHQR